MKKILIKIVLFSILLFIVSCSAEKITDDITIRIEILYEHSVLMVDYSTNEELLQIGLDLSKLSNNDDLTALDMMNEMADSYDIKIDGTYDNQITQLEDKMTIIMEKWVELEIEKQNI